jgi:hypothetical protein
VGVCASGSDSFSELLRLKESWFASEAKLDIARSRVNVRLEWRVVYGIAQPGSARRLSTITSANVALTFLAG